MSRYHGLQKTAAEAAAFIALCTKPRARSGNGASPFYTSNGSVATWFTANGVATQSVGTGAATLDWHIVCLAQHRARRRTSK
jgi:hypothetical protein